MYSSAYVIVGLYKLLVIKRVMLRRKLPHQNCQVELRVKLVPDHGQFAQCWGSWRLCYC